VGRHLAFKCTYNDGGEGDLVGFCGTCSLDNIKRNIEEGRVWCSQSNCRCRMYYDRGFTGNQPVRPCYEAALFRDWRFGAGHFQQGSRKGQPKRIADAGVGSIAILTTRFPDEDERDRRIVGLFRVGEVHSHKETVVVADQKYRLRLPMEEARELYFWDYYRNPGSPKTVVWRTHLFRYLTDSQVARIVKDVKETTRDENTTNQLASLLQEMWGSGIVPPASGPRSTASSLHTQRVARSRKYGPTGEGPEHKQLKEWLANNPARLGYEDVIEVRVERVFRSGDCADIVWQRKEEQFVVIEVETNIPEPGAYQALKYRCLLCAEMGLELTSLDVEAWVVAREIPESVRAFCEKYDIRFEEIRFDAGHSK
jgi:hypothetical protein